MSDAQAPAAVAETSSTAPVEAAQTPKTPEIEVPKKADDFLAPKFAALSRKEKLVREMEKAVKAKETEMDRLRTEYETKSKTSAESEAQLAKKIKENPLKALKELGLTFEQLMQMQMNEENPTTEMQMHRMREEMESKYMSELESLKNSMKEKEENEAKAKWETAVAGYKNELSTYVENNKDAYELVHTRNGVELMFETAEIFYKETGRVPSNEELAQAVEQHLEAEAREILKLKKFQAAQDTKAKPTATAPTLSNTLSAEVPKSGTKLMSDEESKRHAAKLIRWVD